MAVRALIRRKVQKNNISELSNLMRQIRILCLDQPGYISGESLSRLDKVDEMLVISTWGSAKDFNDWLNNPQRIEIQDKIDFILGEATEYEVYQISQQ